MGKKSKIKITVSNKCVKIKSKHVSLYNMMKAREALHQAIQVEEENFNRMNADAMAQQYVDELNASLKR